jgi:hypothetical protein
MKLNPPSWIDPITEACAEGGATCFTTGIDPGFANDLFPMTLMGLCAEVRKVKALEILDYINYTGAYEDEMGIGRPPEFTPLLEHTDILVMSWGATVPMMAHAVGIELDEITTTWDKWVTDVPSRRPRASSMPGEVAAIHFTINGIYKGEPRICLEHVNRVGTDAAPDWPRGTQDDVYRVEIEGTPSITQETAFRFTDGSGRDAAAAGCLATGLRALNAVPAVNDLPPGGPPRSICRSSPGRGRSAERGSEARSGRRSMPPMTPATTGRPKSHSTWCGASATCCSQAPPRPSPPTRPRPSPRSSPTPSCRTRSCSER